MCLIEDSGKPRIASLRHSVWSYAEGPRPLISLQGSADYQSFKSVEMIAVTIARHSLKLEVGHS